MNEIQITNLVDDVVNYREDPCKAHEVCFIELLTNTDEQKEELLSTAMDIIHEVYLAQNN